VPTTYEELYDDLVLLKKRYPASTPITASWGGAHLLAMMGAGYGIPAGWAGTTSYDAAANLWKYAPATDNYKALYTFLNRCYKAGILDPAVFTQTDADFTRKLTDGSALVTVTWITSGFDTWNSQLKTNGIAGGEWAALRVPASTIGLRALPAVDPYRKGLAVSASVANKPYFKQLIAFLDWAVYSDEGMTLTTWGVEGLTFENTASGKAFLPTIVTPKNPAGTVNITAEYGFDSIFNLNEDEEFEDYKKPAEIVTFLDASLKANETAAMSPQLNLGTDAVEAVRIVNEKLAPYVAESSTKFITGELSISNDWGRYLQELGNRGYRTLEKVWNDAWKNQSG
jgi:putative aldouronate transport system substrate-binding protein